MTHAVSKLDRPTVQTSAPGEAPIASTPVRTGRTGVPHALLLTSLTILAAASASPVHAQTQAQIRRAAEKALKPIERSIESYIDKRACFSCHHNGLAIPVMKTAFEHGPADAIWVLNKLERKTFRSPFPPLTAAIEGSDLSDPTPNDSLLLTAICDAGFQRAEAVQVHINRLIRWQHPDGHWATSDFRPPHSSSIFAATSSAISAIRGCVKEAPAAVLARAREWFLANKPNSTEDATFKVIGLSEVGANAEEIRAAADELQSRQLPNGGWPQLAGYPADAYSTGEAVYALTQVALKPEARERGLRFLISTQASDGTWHVRSRMVSPARVSPPYFSTGFPYGHDEFISFAGSAWALRALLVALPKAHGRSGVVDYAKPEPEERLRKIALLGSEADLRRELDDQKIDFIGINHDRGDGVTLLMMAATDEAKVRLLLARGADAKARSKSGTDALTIASGYRNNTGALTALLDVGAQPNLPDGSRVRSSPLVLAAMTGDLDAVRLLLSRGADQNLSAPSNSPLSAAITFGHVDVVKALIEAGAVATLVDGTGINLLHWATITNRPAVIPLLAKAGVAINSMDDNGFTPLHYAASIDFGDTLAIEALLAAGADPKQRDYEERTPLQQATRLGHTNLAKALQKGLQR